MTVQIVDGDLPVGRPRVPRYEASHEQPVRGIVMHLDEHKSTWNSVLEPRVIGAVPLDEFTDCLSARPCLAMPRLPALRLP
jgi:hypothetical protein